MRARNYTARAVKALRSTLLMTIVAAGCGDGSSQNAPAGADGGVMTLVDGGDSATSARAAGDGGTEAASHDGGNDAAGHGDSGVGDGSVTSVDGGGLDGGKPSVDAGPADAHASSDGSVAAQDASADGSARCGSCPSGYTCGTANGLAVCRAPSGIPLFSNVYVIVMENTSLSTLTSAIQASGAPNLAALAAKYATGSDYHGVAHPSLPNYLALTSGDTQGIACDCTATGSSMCGSGLAICTSIFSDCSCPVPVPNVADQIEAAGLTWKDFGESMGTPCNTTDNGDYAQRHNPFLYYTSIQSTARCTSNVVDYTKFNPSAPASLNFIVPNLTHDMHNPSPSLNPTTVNIPNGDAWIGPNVQAIATSTAYASGGLLVVVWDEDDLSGTLAADDPIPIFVLSPYAKASGYASSVHADHYALLATIEDGLALGRLGHAATATPLTDYFPSK
jgi:acid phosphatase